MLHFPWTMPSVKYYCLPSPLCTCLIVVGAYCCGGVNPRLISFPPLLVAERGGLQRVPKAMWAFGLFDNGCAACELMCFGVDEFLQQNQLRMNEATMWILCQQYMSMLHATAFMSYLVEDIWCPSSICSTGERPLLRSGGPATTFCINDFTPFTATLRCCSHACSLKSATLHSTLWLIWSTLCSRFSLNLEQAAVDVLLFAIHSAISCCIASEKYWSSSLSKGKCLEWWVALQACTIVMFNQSNYEEMILPNQVHFSPNQNAFLNAGFLC